MSKSLQERYREYMQNTRPLFSDDQKTKIEDTTASTGGEAKMAVQFRRVIRSIFGDIPLGAIDVRVPKKRKR
jgi:hypothetical protein